MPTDPIQIKAEKIVDWRQRPATGGTNNIKYKKLDAAKIVPTSTAEVSTSTDKNSLMTFNPNSSIPKTVETQTDKEDV